MRPFRSVDDEVQAEFDASEARLIVNLAAQLITLLLDRGGSAEATGDGPTEAELVPEPDLEGADEISPDPVLARLFPDAYPGDADATAEFRRLTENALIDAKVANAQSMVASLTSISTVVEESEAPVVVSLDVDALQAWLRGLTDLRLALASRLGLEHDDDRESAAADDETLGILAVFDWLGLVQESLLEVAESI